MLLYAYISGTKQPLITYYSLLKICVHVAKVKYIWNNVQTSILYLKSPKDQNIDYVLNVRYQKHEATQRSRFLQKYAKMSISVTR